VSQNVETILISGARAPIALELVRSFAKAGHRVIVSDSMHLTIARWSKYTSKYYRTPSPRFATLEFITALKDIILKEKITQYIPTCEETIFVSKYQHELPCKVWTSRHELILQLHHKYNFSQIKQSYLTIPETYLLKKFNLWKDSKEYVFKPCFSRFASSVIMNKTLNAKDFAPAESDHWVVQKKIEGKEVCIYSIFDQGKLKAYVAYQPIYRAGKGAGIFFENYLDMGLRQTVEKFGNEIQYTGQLCFDVIIDKQEQPYFIECNPRGTSGAHLLNQKLEQAFLGETCIPIESYTDYAIKYAMLILHPFSFWKKKVRMSMDCIYDRTDLKPLFLQILSILEITYLKIVKRKSWLEATTGDLEWNGEDKDGY
jgi:predicted ATP-grasp superfamily ATP-dependent carboligase